MKRFAVLGALAAVLAVVAPAVGDTEVNSCSATQAATVSPIIGDTTPTCSFEVTCTGVTTGCAYVWTLDSNGTGLVSAAMTAEVVSPAGEAGWIHADGSGPAPDPSCSGAFQCHDAFGLENDAVLIVLGAEGEGAAVKITCTGGDIAVLQTVSCGVAAVEFGPS